MSPRPRSTSDDDILAGAARVIAREGPARLTLADVGEETGLSPAALVQRFGSKGGLMRAVAEARASTVPGHFAAARELHASALDALLHALARAGDADSPDAVANELAFIHVHLREPAFHPHALAYATAMLAEIRALLDEAVHSGELAPCDTGDLCRTVQTAWNGALATWAIYRNGSLDDWLRGEIEAVLEPFRGEPSNFTQR